MSKKTQQNVEQYYVFPFVSHIFNFHCEKELSLQTDRLFPKKRNIWKRLINLQKPNRLTQSIFVNAFCVIFAKM